MRGALEKLSSHELNDTFPKWLGTLPNLKLLILRSNKLHGPIKASKNKKLFAQLQIMDLSSNVFTGNLPTSLFENFQAMKIIDENVRDPCEGLIPSIIGDHAALRTLNVSHNHLEGRIPASLHQLSVLESLNLSFNKIGGGIPQELAFLTSLEVLNLSHSHLIGCIPKGKQFDTFEKSSYQGNNGLHGFPLSKDCGGDDGVPQKITPVELDEEAEEEEEDEEEEAEEEEEEDDSPMISWQVVLIGYGCGFISVLAIIYIMLSTQTPAWFSRMVDELEYKIITRMQKHKKRY
ncbi:receptor-like protein 9DC3 [Capsicum annuum]|uniref:receptor-like protein 9DC3 n=1 Tax=Capsicum annuum TaxID=4072 RepID=UPI001FB066C4|nr:receptor-like protein 9DC3 [Capsicum annuum]